MKTISCLLCLAFLLLSLGVYAHTSAEVEVQCPLDGKKFITRVDVSGSSFGRELDLKPYGAILAPRSVPVCPQDHFVIYKDAKEFSPEELNRLKPYINSAEYQSLAKDNTAYFLLGKIYEFEKRDIFDIAYTYLQASWEAASEPQYERSARESLKFYKRVLENSSDINDKTQTANLVIGELLRRLKDFAAAQKHFQALTGIPAYQAGIYDRIIKYELELIAQKDYAPHQIPREQPAP